MKLFSGFAVVSVMAAPSRLTWLRLATSKSARFGAAGWLWPVRHRRLQRAAGARLCARACGLARRGNIWADRASLRVLARSPEPQGERDHPAVLSQTFRQARFAGRPPLGL